MINTTTPDASGTAAKASHATSIARASVLALALAFAAAGCSSSGSSSDGASSTVTTTSEGATTTAAGATTTAGGAVTTAEADDGSDAAAAESAELAEKMATLTDTDWGAVIDYADAFDETVTALPSEIQDQWAEVHANLVEVAIEVRDETPSTTATEQWKELNTEFDAFKTKVDAESDAKATEEIDKIGKELTSLGAKF